MAQLPVQVEVFIFRRANKRYEYLLLKRISSRGGFWQPVTGAVEEGESLIDAVRREITEETGIRKIKRVTQKVHHFVLNEPPYQDEYVFGVEVNPTQKVVLDKNVYPEHNEYIWCSFEEAVRLLKWPGNIEGLRKLNAVLLS